MAQKGTLGDRAGSQMQDHLAGFAVGAWLGFPRSYLLPAGGRIAPPAERDCS